MATVADILLEVRTRMRDPALDAILADTPILVALIVRRINSVISASDWSVLRRQTVINTKAPYTAGTISVTRGSASVTGSGTSWDSSLIGGYLTVGAQPPIQVVQVTSATSLVLEAPYPGDDASSIAYQVIFPEYELPESARKVLSLSNGRFRLVEVAMRSIMSADPQRMRLGTPQAFALSGPNKIVLWPTPMSVWAHRVIYVSDQALLEGVSQLPVAVAFEWYGPHTFIVDGVMSDVYLEAYARLGEERYMVLSGIWEQKFRSGLEMAEQADADRRFLPEDVRHLPMITDLPAYAEFDTLVRSTVQGI